MDNNYRRLYRSSDDRVLAGICGGIGEYFSVDPVIVRLVWLVLVLMSGWMALLLYLLAWLIVPRRPETF